MIRSDLKKLIPSSIKNFLLKTLNYRPKFYLKIEIKNVQENYTKILKSLRPKNNIKIAFFLLNVDTWKLDFLYWMFNKHPRFEPIIVICPFLTKGETFLKEELNKSIDFCKLKKYNYFIAYDEIESKVMDVKSIIKPDLVFFTNPNSKTYKELLIDNFLDTLTCYVPYSFRIDTLYEYEYNNRLVNLVWLNFYESNIHKNLAIKYATNKGENVFVSGYPMLDDYKNKSSSASVWGNKGKHIKKIIWAPHWTISNFQNTGLDWSCFLDYHKFILDLANEFKNEIQLAIKPHPFLKSILAQNSLWGDERTEEYFNYWDELDNCQYVEGDYKELFKQSDALIHDSGSFMTEYLVLNKPIAYTVNEKPIKNRFNEFGEIVLSGHQLIYSKCDLRNFIEDLISGVDPLTKEREKIIFEQNLNNLELISEKIITEINNKLT